MPNECLILVYAGGRDAGLPLQDLASTGSYFKVRKQSVGKPFLRKQEVSYIVVYCISHTPNGEVGCLVAWKANTKHYGEIKQVSTWL